jgi:hypothetical protein
MMMLMKKIMLSLLLFSLAIQLCSVDAKNNKKTPGKKKSLSTPLPAGKTDVSFQKKDKKAHVNRSHSNIFNVVLLRNFKAV